jgi:MFS family permease
MDQTSSPAQSRIGPILLSPGYGIKQVLSFLFVTCICVSLNEFANVMLPLVLTQQLHIEPHKQGLVVGTLGAVQQAGTLLCIMAFGALADIYGRRPMLLITLVGFALCMLTYPFISVVFALYVLRFVWGVSFTGYNAGAPTIAMDIPDNRSRGKFNSIVLLVPWLSASAFVLLTSHLPSQFRTLGFTPHLSLIAAFGLVALFPLIGIGTTTAFFKEPRRAPALPGKLLTRMKEMVSNLKVVLKYAGKNRNFGVILFIGSVVRTDTVITGSFLALWIVNAGHGGGVDAITATKTAGLVASIRFITKVIGAPLFGLITDKVNRAMMMLASLAFMTFAFGYFGFVTNVFSIWMMVGAAIIGFAESAEAIASQSLIAQEAPPQLRGSSVGVFTFLGTATLIIINLVGGYLFYKAGFNSPLLMEGAFHLAVLLVSVWLLRKSAVADGL